MKKKNTQELVNILQNTHPQEFADFVNDNENSLIPREDDFGTYMKNKILEKGLTQHLVFLYADISERYGYKILSGKKRTRQRDVILRICYSAKLTLEETQEALKKYDMPELYPKRERDALLMIIFNEHPGSIIDINTLLTENAMEPLRTSGRQD